MACIVQSSSPLPGSPLPRPALLCAQLHNRELTTSPVMTSAGTRATALLFSFSAVVLLFLLQAPPPGLTADLVVSALDRFLDGRCLLELATRRNMILLCHAIILVILRDAGVLGSPASRRSRSPPGEATATAAPVPARPRATRSAVVWRRRPRNRAAEPMHDAAAAAGARRLVECQPAAEATATWAAPLVTTGPPAQAEAEEAAAVATEQIVLAESPRNDDDDDDLLDQYHGRDAVVGTAEHPTAIAVDGERDCDDDRRIVAVAAADEKRMDDDTRAREQQTAGMEMELADDRAFEEFIESQRRKMRQESLQLVSSGYHYQATATCY